MSVFSARSVSSVFKKTGRKTTRRFVDPKLRDLELVAKSKRDRHTHAVLLPVVPSSHYYEICCTVNSTLLRY